MDWWEDFILKGCFLDWRHGGATHTVDVNVAGNVKTLV